MKKVVSLMLVLVLVLGMATMASAAPQYTAQNSFTKLKIAKGNTTSDEASITYEGFSDEVDLGTWTQAQADLDVFTDPINFNNCLSNVEDAKVESEYYLTASAGTTLYLTEAEIKNSKITLKTTITKGAQAIKSGDTKIVYGEYGNDSKGAYVRNSKLVNVKFAQIRMRLNKELVTNNTDGIGYSVKFFLVVDGRQWSNSGITFTGTAKNPTASYNDASDKYVWMGDGTIIEADAYGKDIEMDLDKGVSVFGKMFNGKKYYAIANMDSYNDDEDLLMDKYDIDTVYHIKEAGVAAVADYVKLNNESSDLFVYDGELNYLGKGNDKLPFSKTYYLSAKQLEVEGDEEPIEEDGEGAELPVETGGDDYYPTNVNDNPGTGC